MIINEKIADANIIIQQLTLFCITRSLGRNCSDFLFGVGNSKSVIALLKKKTIPTSQFMIVMCSGSKVLLSVAQKMQRCEFKKQSIECQDNCDCVYVYKEPTSRDEEYLKDLDKRIAKIRDYWRR